MAETLTCPECGVGTVELVVDGYIGKLIIPGYYRIGTELPMQLHQAPFGACNRCEFCIEIKTTERRTA